MTVSMQITKRIYEGNGVTCEWDVDFPVFSVEDVGVYLTSPQGAETEIASDFELNLLTHRLYYPTSASGKAPLAEGWKLTVLRRTPLTQEINLLRQGELDAEVLEKGYDKLTMLVQEITEKVDRSIKYPVSSHLDNLETENFLKNILQAKEEALVASSQASQSSQEAQVGAAAAKQTAEEAIEAIASASSAVQGELAAEGASLLGLLQVQTGKAEEQADLARQYAESSIGKCMGEVYWSQSKAASDNPGALPLWTGEFYITAATLYPDFYDWVKDHPALCVTRADYDARLTQYGECPFYVVDETEGSVRLPKLTHYIKNADASGISQQAAGLPDHTHKTPYGKNDNNGYHNEGSVCAHPATEENFKNIAGYGKASTLASASQPVYGNSSTVTPAHTTLFPWVFAYSAVLPASMLVAAQFVGEISSKADADLANASEGSFDRLLVKSSVAGRAALGSWLVADRAHGTTVTCGMTFPSAGWLWARGSGQLGMDSRVFIDGVEVYYRAINAVSYTTSMIFVNQGEKVTTFENSTGVFYPCKGVVVC